ncbi:MAG: hypothetical protein WD971_08265 [Pirellulales bacterium]
MATRSGRYVSCATITFIGVLLAVAPAAAQSPGEWQASAWQLWRIDVDGTNLEPLDTTPDDRCGSPDWSPDGKIIAYDVLSDSGGSYQVAVIRGDGTDRRLIARGSIPTWSPDGKLIACQGNGIQIMNADGSGYETRLGSAFSLRWSPRGNAIIAGIGNSLLLLDLATGKQQNLLSSTKTISHGYGISPDGLRFCFGSPSDGLSVAELDDQTMQVTTRQVVGTGTAYHASWAPDGKRVVFAWRPKPGDLTQLYTLDVDAKVPPKPLPGVDTTRQNVNPDWSPDGKSIVFSRPAPLTSLP